MVYAGFWRRFAALWLDFLILSPTLALAWWGPEHFRLFNLYYLVPGLALSIFYSVYLVRRFGGTPGKRLMKVRITKVDGSPVGYREAFLRYLPEFLMSIALAIAAIIGELRLTDAEYFGATSFMERQKLVEAAGPAWYGSMMLAMNIWIWGEFVVMMTNRKRRALHDFIAGTVVVRDGLHPAAETAGVGTHARDNGNS